MIRSLSRDEDLRPLFIDYHINLTFSNSIFFMDKKHNQGQIYLVDFIKDLRSNANRLQPGKGG